MDLNFDILMDMEPWTPTRPSTPTPTKICSQLQQLAKEVDQHSTFETAEKNLTSDSASTTIPNTVKAPLPKENTLNSPTLNENSLNAPTPSYVPPPIMLKVTDTYKQQMKIITDKLPSTRGKLTVGRWGSTHVGVFLGDMKRAAWVTFSPYPTGAQMRGWSPALHRHCNSAIC
ncbi:hypothetical protein TNIN_276401 [Trichonephila inaurata madagascariensis]|uniref:Uncharacterized protein n=1 Tax=Trichonephila inaurata madagascariensis TaxID=2747483 RepID=A0A8X6WMQ1_9ARAC|nr:hypothetical protein TNIN_276401 [Trichonephila inaurata madagascariensis]